MYQIIQKADHKNYIDPKTVDQYLKSINIVRKSKISVLAASEKIYS